MSSPPCSLAPLGELPQLLEVERRPRCIDTLWKVSYNPPAPTTAAEGESR